MVLAYATYTTDCTKKHWGALALQTPWSNHTIIGSLSISTPQYPCVVGLKGILAVSVND